MWPLLAIVAVIGVLFIGVYPTRTYFTQRSALKSGQHQLDVLNGENQQLDQRVQELNTDAEIERIAREQYGLVRPGEEAYAILPAPPPPLAVPHAWPFTGIADKVDALNASKTTTPAPDDGG
jgi:cell division protein FtsB